MAAERRSCPRYPLDCAVVVSTPAGATFDAVAINLSLVIMQIGCNAALLTALLQQQRLPYGCRVQFVLEGCDFDIDAQLITYRRLSHQQYVLVLRLRHADDGQQAQLDQMISKLADSAARRAAELP